MRTQLAVRLKVCQFEKEKIRPNPNEQLNRALDIPMVTYFSLQVFLPIGSWSPPPPCLPDPLHYILPHLLIPPPAPPFPLRNHTCYLCISGPLNFLSSDHLFLRFSKDVGSIFVFMQLTRLLVVRGFRKLWEIRRSRPATISCQNSFTAPNQDPNHNILHEYTHPYGNKKNYRGLRYQDFLFSPYIFVQVSYTISITFVFFPLLFEYLDFLLPFFLLPWGEVYKTLKQFRETCRNNTALI